MRESPSFRANLEQLNQRFPGQEFLTIREVAEYIGNTPNTAKRRFPFVCRSDENPHGGCTKVQLAKAIGG